MEVPSTSVWQASRRRPYDAEIPKPSSSALSDAGPQSIADVWIASGMKSRFKFELVYPVEQARQPLSQPQTAGYFPAGTRLRSSSRMFSTNVTCTDPVPSG